MKIRVKIIESRGDTLQSHIKIAAHNSEGVLVLCERLLHRVPRV